MSFRSSVFLVGLAACLGILSCARPSSRVPEPAKVRASSPAEEAFFQAALVPVRKELNNIAPASEGNNAPDILSPDHPLSKTKPNLTIVPLLSGRLVTDNLREIAFDHSVYEMPITAVSERRGGETMLGIKAADYSLVVSPSLIRMMSLEIPRRLLRLAKTPEGIKICEAIRAAFEEEKQSREFDRLLRVMCADAGGIQPGVPIGERVINLYRLGVKAALGKEYDEKTRYYIGPYLRALVSAPDDYEAKAQNAKGETIDRGPERAIVAWVEFKGENRVCELRFRASAAGVAKLSPEFVEDFLSRCRLKKAYVPPQPVAGEPGSHRTVARGNVKPPIKLIIKETSLGKVPDELSSVQTAPDGKHVGYIWPVDGKVAAVIDGKQGETYDEIDWDHIFFSKNGERYAYRAKKAGKLVFVVDGLENEAYEDLGWGPGFSPDSAHSAYLGIRGGKCFLVLDGKVAAQNNGRGNDFRWSPDGNHWAHNAWYRPDPNVWLAKCFIVLDGEPQQEYADVTEPVFSPDGKHLVYAAEDDGKPRKTMIILDGEKWKEFEGCTIEKLAFTNGSGKLVCIMQDKDHKRFAVVDNAEGKKYEDINYLGLVLSPRDDGIAYLARSGEKDAVVRDGVEIGNYDRPGKGDLAIDTPVGRLEFSPDGKHLAYTVCRKGNAAFMLDGATLFTCDDIGKEVLFSPDSKRFAFMATRNGKSFMVVDGQEQQPYAVETWPVCFSPDSKHFAYYACTDDSWVLVVDGVETEAGYDSFSDAKIVFDGPNAFHTVALSDGELLQLDIRIEPQ